MVSKDVLYEPMREIAARYPPWLAANRASLLPAELADYEAQLEYVQQIVAAYEEAPGDAPQLMALLQGMQARGQPPAEIVDALAPRLGGGGAGGGGGLPGGLPPECCLQ
jgi:peroxin-19